MRIVVFCGAVFAAAALTLGPSGGGASVVQQGGGTFRAASMAGWFTTIDPVLTASGVDATILNPACGPLMLVPERASSDPLGLEPEVAAAEPMRSRDRRTYTFTLRADARFSTGGRVQPRDVVQTFRRLLSPEMKSPLAELFLDLVGAQAFVAGKSTSLPGVVARGRTVEFRLIRPASDFPARTGFACILPSGVPVDPEGAKAPIPSAAPYYFAEYVPGERVVLQRNRFYAGKRPRNVDRIVVDVTADASALERVASGELDTVLGTPDLNPQLADLARRFGVNRTRLLVRPGLATRMFFMNTQRPLFRDNVELRQAFNFAADRKALVREFGEHVASVTDQYLPPRMPGFRQARIYPLEGPDLRKARQLARGNTRSGKAVLYTCARPDCLAAGQILQRNVRRIGIELEIQQFPTSLFFEKIETPGEPFDLAWVGWSAAYTDPKYFLNLFDGNEARRGGAANYSRYNSRFYNGLLGRAAQLEGEARLNAYGELDVLLTRDAAPAIAYANGNAWAFVSARTGCVVMNPILVLNSVCLR